MTTRQFSPQATTPNHTSCHKKLTLCIVALSIFESFSSTLVSATVPYTKRPTSVRNTIRSSPKNVPLDEPLIFLLRGGGPDDDEDDVTPKMPTLFNSDEMLYDRYAACLAATEGLRRARDVEISSLSSESNSQNMFGSFAQKLGAKRNVSNEAGVNEAKKRAEAKFIVNSSRVIRALGLTVPQFNTLGREVVDDSNLKQRVMEQAYLYRMTATLSMPKTPLLQSDTQFLKSNRRKRIQMFAKTAMEIEHLRQSQMDKLCKALQVDTLPADLNICDEKVLPLLSPKVRAVVEAFPLQAEEIVRKYGLNSDEFNRMLDKSNKDAVFRWKVQRSVSKMEGGDGSMGEGEDDL